MDEICSDNRFEIIERAKEDIIKNTNIETSNDEMKVLNSFLFRCWQMGWLMKYDDEEHNNTRIEQLEDELETMRMQYISQVSKYKSMYEESNKKINYYESRK